MLKRFWICYVEGTHGGTHYQHQSFCDAQSEAQRLAYLNEGKKVYVMACVGASQKVTTTWEDADEIPF
jgi:hypothetical protein